MRLLLLITLLIAAVSSSMNDRLRKLSPKDTTNLLKCVDNLADGIDFDTCSAFYKEKLGTEFNKDDVRDVRTRLHQLLFDHMNQKSWYSKMAGLVSFSNILLILLVFAVIAFIFVLFGQVIAYCALFLAVFLYEILFCKTAMYVYALTVSYLTVYFRYERDIVGTRWETWYILDQYSVIVGLVTLTAVIVDIAKRKSTGKSPTPLFLLLAAIYAGVALYHDHWFVATMSVWSIYAAIGFTMGAMPGGYYSGFQQKEQPLIAFITSVVLVGTFLMLQTGVLKTDFPNKVALFENGSLFFGSFIGLLSMLIMSDRYYCSLVGRTNEMYVLMQFFMVGTCLVTLYFGNVLNITTLNSVGGTFLVLWLLDMQCHMFNALSPNSLLLALAMIILNLFGLRYFIMNYRDYFIF